MKRLTLFALLSAMILTSCTDIVRMFFKNGLINSWKFSYMNNSNLDTTNTNSRIINLVSKRFHYGFLRLYMGHKYTFVGQNTSAMHSWSFDKTSSTLTIDSFINSTDVKFKMIKCDHGYLKMDLSGFGDTAINGEDNTFFWVDDSYFEYANVDLLSYPENSWRIKPSHKENNAEIMKRVMAHLDYNIAYYQMIEDDHRHSFIPMYLQTPLKFYQNAIGVCAEENINKGWESCFYDHDDAVKGWKILADAINGMGQYPSAKNYTEGYLKALKKMKEFLDKIK